MSLADSGSGGGSSTDGSSSDEEGDEPEAGSCNAWKVSYCRAVAECGSVQEKRDCEDDVGYVVCQSDAPFGACQKKFDTIAKKKRCGDWPKACEPRDLADRSSPVQVCQLFHRAICEWRQFCNPLVTLEECEIALETSEPCSEYLAVLPNAEACLDVYGVLSCGERVPEECATKQILR